MKTENSGLNLIFAGTPDFAAVSLAALIAAGHSIKAVYTQPDRGSGRGQKSTASPVKQVAIEHALPLYQPETLRDEQEQKILAELKADLMIVVAYGLILPPQVLTAPRLGCINVHASLLPRWRGAAPIQRAILAGDAKTGVTIMQMDAGLDTGDMLLKAECPIEKKDTSQLLHDRLAKIGADALLIALDRLTKQTLHPEQQDEARVTYAHKISKEEAFMDWEQSARALERKIRAFNPWPVAQTMLEGQVVRVWQADVIEKEITPHQRGQILQVSREGIDVETGEGILRLQKLQFPGGKILSVHDILNSRRETFKPGVTFG